MSAKIVKGDTVVVLVGKDKGKTGEVSKVFPKKGRAIISGINMAIKHLKQSEKNAGGRIPQEASIHLSNLAIWASTAAFERSPIVSRNSPPVSYTHLTLPTTPYV